MPEVKDAKELDLPAGGTVPYAFDAVGGRLHEDAQHVLVLDVALLHAGRQDGFSRRQARKAATETRQYRIGPHPEAAARFADHPTDSSRWRSIRGICKQAEAAAQQLDARLAAADKDSLRQTMALEAARLSYSWRSADGTYELAVAVDGWKDPFVRTFQRTHFPWRRADAAGAHQFRRRLLRRRHSDPRRVVLVVRLPPPVRRARPRDQAASQRPQPAARP